MLGRSGVILPLFVITLCIFDGAIGATPYQMIGCYIDEAETRDLQEHEFQSADLTVALCTLECRKLGWAYSGLQAGENCYCGSNYDNYGMANIGTCNFTCDGEPCGGALANSIYYSVNGDPEVETNREDVFQSNPLAFEAARQICIKNGGDMLMLNGDEATVQTAINATLNLVAESGSETEKIWVGLRKEKTDGPLTWVNPSTTPYVHTDYAQFWKDTETMQNPCVVISTNGKWETTSCFAQYPYVCHQQPGLDNGGNTDGSNDDAAEEPKNNLALMIVLPLFLFCYGGSCVIYCIGKAYRNCKKKQRKKMLLESDQFTEFEPDTKPPPPVQNKRPASKVPGERVKTAKPPPTAQRSRSPRPPPTARQEVKDKREVTSPVQQIGSAKSVAETSHKSPAPGEKPQDSARSSASPPNSSRPATSRGVEINMRDSQSGSNSPDDGRKSAADVRKEHKRNKLLENALREARQRRERERSGKGERTSPEGQEAPASLVHENEKKSRGRTPQNNRYSPDSGDSRTSLIPDKKKDEPRDPTHMSIKDILEVKRMMKEARKRQHKIVTS